MISLQLRILIAASVVLIVFLTIVGWVLDQSRRDRELDAATLRLNSYAFKISQALLLDEGEIYVELVNEPKLYEPNSGLYAQVLEITSAGEPPLVVWESNSAKARNIPFSDYYDYVKGIDKYRHEMLPNDYDTRYFGVTYVIDAATPALNRLSKQGGAPPANSAPKVKDATNNKSSPPSAPDSRGGSDKSGAPPPTPSGQGKSATSTAKTNADPSIDNNPPGKPMATTKLAQTKPGQTKPGQTKSGQTKPDPNGTVTEIMSDDGVRYVIQVSESVKKTYAKRVSEFRISLVKWLGGLAVTLLAALFGIIQWWGMGPMRRVAQNLDEIKVGKAAKLAGPHPKELKGLAESINQLIYSERAQQERYRNSLGDLAHSLKTPLSVLHGLAEDPNQEDLNTLLKEQVLRMRDIVDYQLQRAAAAGRTTNIDPVPLLHSVSRIASTVSRAYSSKNIQCTLDISEDIDFLGDEGDLMEMMGNLIENAFKWCESEVLVSAEYVSQGDNEVLSISIEDNGPGISAYKIDLVQKRGFRADQSTAGQGIGLAVVKEIISAYKGELQIGESEKLGGARFTVII